MGRVMDVAKLILLFLVLDGVPRVEGLDSRCATLLSGLDDCYTKEGLTSPLPKINNINLDMDAMFDELSESSNPELICRNQKAYERSQVCALDLTRNCVPDEAKRLMPDAKRAVEGIRFFCRNEDRFDVSCIKNNASPYKDCVLPKIQNFAKMAVNGKRDQTFLICTPLHIAMECIAKVFSSCDCNTTQILLESNVNYQHPDRCPYYDVSTLGTASCPFDFKRNGHNTGSLNDLPYSMFVLLTSWAIVMTKILAK